MTPEQKIIISQLIKEKTEEIELTIEKIKIKISRTKNPEYRLIFSKTREQYYKYLKDLHSIKEEIC